MYNVLHYDCYPAVSEGGAVPKINSTDPHDWHSFPKLNPGRVEGFRLALKNGGRQEPQQMLL